MDEPKGTHRTRSRAASDWTVEESLILVNEINAIESEWGATLPTFQKWKQIVENCNALDVSRSLNQCKRKWDVLLSVYIRIKREAAEADVSFPVELFKAIERCVNVNGKKNGGGEAEATEEEVAKIEEQLVMETDPDSDPEAQGPVTKKFFEIGSKKQRRRMKRKKHRLETLNPWGYFTSPKTKHEECSSINEKVTHIVESMPEESNVETEEQIMANVLYKNAVQINAILEGNLADDVDYKLVDLNDAEAVQIDLTRHQGDKLIDCLAKFSVTLNQLCDLVQQCK